jgi:hypothetical protein
MGPHRPPLLQAKGAASGEVGIPKDQRDREGTVKPSPEVRQASHEDISWRGANFDANQGTFAATDTAAPVMLAGSQRSAPSQ